MKKYIITMLLIICTFSMVACGSKDTSNEIQLSTTKTETISFHDKTFNKSDLSQETIEWLEMYNSLSEEEQLSINYIPNDLYNLCGYANGEDVKVLEATPIDLIPMVMVNGEIYMDCGKKSNTLERTDHFDGEIISQVKQNEKPTKDDQSNFGVGYGYQYGSTPGIIEICINGEWFIFATEKVLASSQMIIEPIEPKE